MTNIIKRVLPAAVLGLLAIPAWSLAAGETDAGKTVLSFYKKYIADGMAEKNAALSSYKELDRACIDKINGMIVRAKKQDPELGGLDFDPIIWGQDLPGGVVVEKNVVGNGAALFTLKKTWEGEEGEVQRICVSLRERKSGWRIVDTVDPGLLDKKDCASFKPGGMFPAVD